MNFDYDIFYLCLIFLKIIKPNERTREVSVKLEIFYYRAIYADDLCLDHDLFGGTKVCMHYA